MTAVTTKTREMLDKQWMHAVKVAGNLTHIRVAQEYGETKNLISLLDRKLKLVQTIATVIHGRGDEYTVNTFEGALLGGLNDYRIDIPFADSPTTRMSAIMIVMSRLTLLRHFLELAFDYFRLDGEDSPLYENFVGDVYPNFMAWIHDQTENLTAS